MEKNKAKTAETLRRMTAPGACVRVREKDGEERSRAITGYAILFDTPSAPLYSDDTEEIREVIDPGAVTLDLLNASDIKFTMYHDRQILLGRSKEGQGTLRYFIDEKGVGFDLELPSSPNGDEALEMVSRGDITGCSFAFTTHYYDRDYVGREVKNAGGRTEVTYRVKVITGIYDFTLTDNPAYPATSVEARDFISALREREEAEPAASAAAEVAGQISEMRRAAARKIMQP